MPGRRQEKLEAEVQQVQQADHQAKQLEEQMIDDGGRLMRMNEGAQWENKMQVTINYHYHENEK